MHTFSAINRTKSCLGQTNISEGGPQALLNNSLNQKINQKSDQQSIPNYILLSRESHLSIAFWRIKAEKQCLLILLWKEVFQYFSFFWGESYIVSLCTNVQISLPSSDVLDVKAQQGLCWSSPKALHTHFVRYSGLRRRKFIIHGMRLHIQTRSHLSVAQAWISSGGKKKKKREYFFQGCKR